jgi:hypothetical protein
MDADGDGGAYGEARGVDDRDGVVGAIGDDNCGSVRRDASQAGTSANMKRGRNRTSVEIKNRNVGGTGICNVSAVPVRRDIDEVRASVDADGSDDFILFRVDHADVRRPAVNNVNFISLWIGRDSSRLGADLERSYRAKAAQIDDGNRIALAISYICILAVERSVAGKSALVEVIPSGGEDERDEDGD